MLGTQPRIPDDSRLSLLICPLNRGRITAIYEPQPVIEAPEDWSQNSYVQIEGGFLAGLALGFVPYGGVGHQVLDAAHILPRSLSNARLGVAVGQIATLRVQVRPLNPSSFRRPTRP